MFTPYHRPKTKVKLENPGPSVERGPGGSFKPYGPRGGPHGEAPGQLRGMGPPEVTDAVKRAVQVTPVKPVVKPVKLPVVREHVGGRNAR
jgi:hypothetical protein